MEQLLIRTNRFFLRPLELADVTETYAGWFRDEAALQYIASASSQQDIAAIREYVAARSNRDDVLFLGIFVTESGAHIGNIKFEPMDPKTGVAYMGILIGEGNWRGAGVTPEVLDECSDWLYANRGISRILLGVKRDNVAAIRAYEKAGFKPAPLQDQTSDISALRMVRAHAGVRRRLAIGTVQFGMRYGVANQSGQVPLADIQRIMGKARSAGIDTLDTAIAYGDSESNLGKAGVDGWRVISKLPPVPETCGEIGEWVRNSVAESLGRLNTARLHGLLLHRPANLLGAQGDGLYSALLNLKEQGLVEKIGVSIYAPEELSALLPRFAIDLVQAPFNLVDRRLQSSGWLSRLKQQGIEVHTRSAFLQGLLLMTAAQRDRKFDRWQPLWNRWERWLEQENVTPVAACLGFVLSQPEIDRVVVGLDSEQHLSEMLSGVGSANLAVPADFQSDDPELINPSRWTQL